MVQKETKPSSQSKYLSKYLSDSDSDDNEINPRLKTSIEERQYNTIPRPAIATQIALNHSRVQVNPTMDRGPPQRSVKTKKPSTEDRKRWKPLALHTKTNNDQLL